MLPSATLRVLSRLLLLPAAVCGCSYPRSLVPDQSGLLPITHRRYAGQTVVRLYAAPIPVIARLAIHTWIVIRRRGAVSRWEVWQRAGGRYGHVRRNLRPPEAGVGAGAVHVLAELTGLAAERVADRIERWSPRYRCRHDYRYFPGPNSNTYVRWVLAISGWQAQLPVTAIGASVYRHCLAPRRDTMR